MFFLERTDEYEDAWRKMDCGKAFVFVTGRAGTGKSTLLREFVEQNAKKIPVLAPTGVAALNVQGETIHRFFKIPPGVDLERARQEAEVRKNPAVYKQIGALIVDEISMVRADLMDAMDVFLQTIRHDKRPFGGVRIIGIGDLYQLPPVLTPADQREFGQKYRTPYFFSSTAYRRLHAADQIDAVELTKIYRQKDKGFIEILNAIRNREITEKQLAKLNRRIETKPPRDAICLTPTNEAANAINQAKLDKVANSLCTFQGETKGQFSERDMPTDFNLALKVGARVMCVANDLKNKYVNGSLGWISGMKYDQENNPSVTVQLDNVEEPVSVEPFTWNLYRTRFNRATRELEQEEIGSFRQIPLKLAWAVTIHKSQGKTFDQVTLDLGRGAFAAGQIYVALSRCRALKGLHLVRPVTLDQLKANDEVTDFFQNILNQPAQFEYEEFPEYSQMAWL